MQLETLQKQFSAKIARDKLHKEAFDKLYQEMCQYKENFIFSALRPILADLILLYDNIGRMEQFATGDEAVQVICDIREEIIEILYRQDVEEIPPTGKKLDRKLQRAVKTVPTQDPSEDGDVIEVMRQGFLRGSVLMRPQEVICKRIRS